MITRSFLNLSGFDFPTNQPEGKVTLALTWMFSTIQKQATVSEDSLERIANTENIKANKKESYPLS